MRRSDHELLVPWQGDAEFTCLQVGRSSKAFLGTLFDSAKKNALLTVEYRVVNIDMASRKSSEWRSETRNLAKSCSIPVKLDQNPMLKMFENVEGAKQFKVNKTIQEDMIDLFDHLNFVYHISFVLETVFKADEDNFLQLNGAELSELAISFEDESLLGQELTVCIWNLPEQPRTICAKVTCGESLRTFCVMTFTAGEAVYSSSRL
jgi:hypothetical protein